jgi:hypothetical protein
VCGGGGGGWYILGARDAGDDPAGPAAAALRVAGSKAARPLFPLSLLITAQKANRIQH